MTALRGLAATFGRIKRLIELARIVILWFSVLDYDVAVPIKLVFHFGANTIVSGVSHRHGTTPGLNI